MVETLASEEDLVSEEHVLGRSMRCEAGSWMPPSVGTAAQTLHSLQAVAYRAAHGEKRT